MLRRLLRILLPGGLLVGAVVLVRRSVALRSELEQLTPSAGRWTPLPEPPPVPAAETPADTPAPAAETLADPPAPAPETPALHAPAAETLADPPAEETPAAGTPVPDVQAAGMPAWVGANEDGSIPSTHPIKAKAASGIYHLPGMVNYARTKPDRCYADEAAAVADGFTRAKR